VNARVSQYIGAQPPVARRALRQLRSAIRATSPDAVEGFGYGMPGFRLGGRPLVWYAAWKAHTSLYAGTAIVRTLRSEGRRLETSKGTIRFPLAKALPVGLVKRVVRLRRAQLRSGRKGG